MTRDNALNNCIDVVSINGEYIPQMLEKLEIFVDKIYEDFEVEKEHFEIRIRKENDRFVWEQDDK